MDKRPAARVYGLLGYPVKHSFSPAMHNAAFIYLKLDAEYRLFPLKPEELETFFKNLNRNNIYGLNITIPYKEKVLTFLRTLTDEARLIGAVNTIKVNGGRLEGFNTDGEGFLRHISADLEFNPGGKSIAIIGAGGASRAISVYLSQQKPKRITIYDIDKTKLQALVCHLKKNFQDIDFKSADSIDSLGIEGSDLLVNASSVGMKEDDPCLIKPELISKNTLVYDLIYNPRETKLLKMAKENGCRVSNGLGMLLYQGMIAFEIWTGRIAPGEIMHRSLETEIGKC